MAWWLVTNKHWRTLFVTTLHYHKMALLDANINMPPTSLKLWILPSLTLFLSYVDSRVRVTACTPIHSLSSPPQILVTTSINRAPPSTITTNVCISLSSLGKFSVEQLFFILFEVCTPYMLKCKRKTFSLSKGHVKAVTKFNTLSTSQMT